MNHKKLLPFSQNDSDWADELMWDRDRVINALILDGNSRSDAEGFIHKYKDGNTIGNEGCLLTSLAMVLHLLDSSNKRSWTPSILNAEAQDRLFYTKAGLSLVPLYADLVSEVTNGAVQLCAKEEYFAGERGWPRNFANTSTVVRAYRRLSREDRQHCVVMLKTGTYDDSFASHYLLLDPNQTGSPEDDDPVVLDPAMPFDSNRKSPWRLSDSDKWLRTDKKIRGAWDKKKIEPQQIGGVWVFARWRAEYEGLLLGPLAKGLSEELATKI